MKLTLTIDGKKKEYHTRGIPMRASIAAFRAQEDLTRRMQDGAESLYDEEHIESLLQLVVDLFDRQFSEQDLLDGCNDSFFVVIPAMLDSIVQGVNAAIQEFPRTDPNAKAPPVKRATKLHRGS